MIGFAAFLRAMKLLEGVVETGFEAWISDLLGLPHCTGSDWVVYKLFSVFRGGDFREAFWTVLISF